MAGSVSEVGAVVSEAGGVDGEDQQPLQRKFLAAFFYTGLPRLVRFQLMRYRLRAANNFREEMAVAGSVSEVCGVASEGGGVDREDQQPL